MRGAEALFDAAEIAVNIPKPDIPGGVIDYDFRATRDKIAAAIRASLQKAVDGVPK